MFGFGAWGVCQRRTLSLPTPHVKFAISPCCVL